MKRSFVPIFFFLVFSFAKAQREDTLVQPDIKPAILLKSQSRDIKITGRYLLLSIKNSEKNWESDAGKLSRLTISSGDKPFRIMNVELAEKDFDWQAPVDMTGFSGEYVTVMIDKLPEGSHALDNIVFSDSPPGKTPVEDHIRPQFHFTARFGRVGDPNGLIYAGGLWHLFFQHNPYMMNWVDGQWGHATSNDLVHWNELPGALLPFTLAKQYVCSGSAIVDKDNTAGFGTGTLIAFFTDTGWYGEALAFSKDNGTSFTYFERNPLFKHAGRDPKVFWYAPGKHWTMIVYDQAEHGRPIEGKKCNAIYSSDNLKNWTLESKIEGFFECPELFALPVDGNPNETIWLMFGANNQYLPGSFDGKTFTPSQTAKAKGNFGNCLYAAQTFNDAPDGRRIQIAWAPVKYKGSVFTQTMTVPVEFSLRRTPDGVKLFSNPVRELEKLRGAKQEFQKMALDSVFKKVSGASSELSDVLTEFSLGGAETINLKIAGLTVSYDAKKELLSCDKCNAPLKLHNGKLSLRILVDRGIVEIFANKGEVYMPVGAPQGPDVDFAISVGAKGNGAALESATVYKMISIWQREQIN